MEYYNVIDKIIEKYQDKNKNESLIPLLQDINQELNYLPEDTLINISNKLDIPLNRIYSVVTFYTAFTLEPRGKNIINVCDGTSCHVRGSEKIISTIEQKLKIKIGETSKDKNFTLEIVRCVGCCSLSPVIRIGENKYGRMNSRKMKRLIKKYSK